MTARSERHAPANVPYLRNCGCSAVMVGPLFVQAVIGMRALDSLELGNTGGFATDPPAQLPLPFRCLMGK